MYIVFMPAPKGEEKIRGLYFDIRLQAAPCFHIPSWDGGGHGGPPPPPPPPPPPRKWGALTRRYGRHIPYIGHGSGYSMSCGLKICRSVDPVSTSNWHNYTPQLIVHAEISPFCLTGLSNGLAAQTTQHSQHHRGCLYEN